MDPKQLLQDAVTETGLANFYKHVKTQLKEAEKKAQDPNALTIGTVATAAQIEQFETRHQIVLPWAYKKFLLEVCNGIKIYGAPSFFSLEEAEKSLELDKTKLHIPFAYSKKDGDFILSAMKTYGNIDQVYNLPAMAAVKKAGFPNGCLVLADYGCNDYSVLVVNGEEAGHVWRAGEYEIPEYSRLYGADGTYERLKYKFAEWIIYGCEIMLGIALFSD